MLILYIESVSFYSFLLLLQYSLARRQHKQQLCLSQVQQQQQNSPSSNASAPSPNSAMANGLANSVMMLRRHHNGHLNMSPSPHTAPDDATAGQQQQQQLNGAGGASGAVGGLTNGYTSSTGSIASAAATITLSSSSSASLGSSNNAAANSASSSSASAFGLLNSPANHHLLVNVECKSNLTNLESFYDTNNKMMMMYMKSSCPNYFQLSRSARKRLVRFLSDNGWLDVNA